MVTTVYFVWLNLGVYYLINVYFNIVFRDVALFCFRIKVLLNIITKGCEVGRKFGKMGLGQF